LDQARDRSFDVVIVEALDRLSRDMEDLTRIHKWLSFLGTEIRAVTEVDDGIWLASFIL
jgi:site-specific DNA recombinase